MCIGRKLRSEETRIATGRNPEGARRGHAAEMLGRIGERLRNQPKPLVFGLAVLTIAVVGFFDTILPRQLSLAVFHVVPVFAAIWFVGPRAGVALAVLSSLVWFVSDELSTFAKPTPALELWDFGVKVSFFLVISALIQRAKRASEQASALARSDDLTGIANRRGFFEFVDRELARARRYSRSLTVVYIDIDDFKRVNDRFGHDAGDRLLRGVAATIERSLRSVDVVGRLGGDEFVILLPETDLAAARVVLAKLQTGLAEYFRTTQHLISVSMGVASFRSPPASLDEMLKTADELMYQAKRQGKGSACLAEYPTEISSA
jgi:diguanylate cyclase (GGDEF)-like protein